MDQCMQTGKHGIRRTMKIKWILFYTLGITFIIGGNVWLAKRDAKLFNELNFQPSFNYDQETIQTNQDS